MEQHIGPNEAPGNLSDQAASGSSPSEILPSSRTRIREEVRRQYMRQYMRRRRLLERAGLLELGYKPRDAAVADDPVEAVRFAMAGTVTSSAAPEPKRKPYDRSRSNDSVEGRNRARRLHLPLDAGSAAELGYAIRPGTAVAMCGMIPRRDHFIIGRSEPGASGDMRLISQDEIDWIEQNYGIEAKQSMLKNKMLLCGNCRSVVKRLERAHERHLERIDKIRKIGGSAVTGLEHTFFDPAVDVLFLWQRFRGGTAPVVQARCWVKGEARITEPDGLETVDPLLESLFAGDEHGDYIDDGHGPEIALDTLRAENDTEQTEAARLKKVREALTDSVRFRAYPLDGEPVLTGRVHRRTKPYTADDVMWYRWEMPVRWAGEYSSAFPLPPARIFPLGHHRPFWRRRIDDRRGAMDAAVWLYYEGKPIGKGGFDRRPEEVKYMGDPTSTPMVETDAPTRVDGESAGAAYVPGE